MTYTYIPRGVCSRKIEFELENGVIQNMHFSGGCSGNTAGLSQLVEGMNAADVIARLKGVRCGMRPTSCPDQMAQALEAALAKESE